ncbi:NAD-dependent dehydratase [Terrabacter tumescens]|uniref:NAD-dependent dehydratase n=1 Tax=Terrabacter tumescens TaxID=60443 RepID=A0ABQ2HPT8_9MICO|nr:NAD(P)-dependent oxidoreductase [Terrabacter tumescens]GGM86669.1 NAD-dependent dehydratase [Terrabacter tumescens]
MALLALTGASGRIATALRPRLRAAGHHLVLVDGPGVPLRDVDPATERAVESDLRDVDTQAEAFAGADLVVHLGAHSDERAWADILAVNIDGTHAVCEAARLAGVPRLLLASSVHAAGFVPVDAPLVREGMPLPAPDTYYGVSKAALEALGGLYAGRFGMTVVSARIMTFDDAPGGPRSLQSWLSPDDMTRLVLATLTTGAVGHHVVWGVSRNTRRRVDLAPGLAIGFDPQDDAEVHASGVERRDPSRPPGVLGGAFADAAYLLGVPHGGTRPAP